MTKQEQEKEIRALDGFYILATDNIRGQPESWLWIIRGLKI